MSDNAVTTVLDDAEKIAEELVPPVAAVPRVLGVVVAQLDMFLKSSTGKGLENLAEAALGIAPPPAPDAPAAPTGESAADVALAAKVANQETEIAELRELVTSKSGGA